MAVRRMQHIHYKHLVPLQFVIGLPCFKTGTLHFFGISLPNIDRFSTRLVMYSVENVLYKPLNNDIVITVLRKMCRVATIVNFNVCNTS